MPPSCEALPRQCVLSRPAFGRRLAGVQSGPQTLGTSLSVLRACLCAGLRVCWCRGLTVFTTIWLLACHLVHHTTLPSLQVERQRI